jgi:hypothetical protein
MTRERRAPGAGRSTSASRWSGCDPRPASRRRASMSTTGWASGWSSSSTRCVGSSWTKTGSTSRVGSATRSSGSSTASATRNARVSRCPYPQFSFDNPTSSDKRRLVEPGTELVLPFQLARRVGSVEMGVELGSSLIEHAEEEWFYGLAAAWPISKRFELLGEVHGDATADFDEHVLVFDVAAPSISATPSACSSPPAVASAARTRSPTCSPISASSSGSERIRSKTSRSSSRTRSDSPTST